MSYSKFVNDRIKPGQDILDSLSPEKCETMHMMLGISGEAGELLDAVKKHLMYEKDLDLTHVIEELGDIEFYLEGFRQSLGITRENVITENMAKLSKRYPARFSNEQAELRADKQDEIPVTIQPLAAYSMVLILSESHKEADNWAEEVKVMHPYSEMELLWLKEAQSLNVVSPSSVVVQMLDSAQHHPEYKAIMSTIQHRGFRTIS